ncbi:GATA zinc finger domain-containing protein 14-like isoform X3 [Homarus americanus]|uniref:GATA zinc finger domain-containing protein 14-like isoform X1 n=1 Tax=Homarus americanus TaxID=6706 RepID=UPI001C4951AE|nr:GATA zinc finger domain-containing protein 14-like isoform X1 [Homarus americanus]XP_042229295.1 GATA zinc finger domain-containing protein 14-like isoform X2 [Homarus americanus]XP_042229296.1 GATA zinc finger domain-containing protein 14-like isoform X3 [Homarus americanus]
MKTFIIVVAAALAAGQQFQQTRDFTPAVRLADQGFFQQTGRTSFIPQDSNNQFQSSSFQSNSNSQNTQRDNLGSGFVGSSVSSQSGTFLDSNQFQSNEANRNLLRNRLFQQNQRNTFNSNDFQQSSGRLLKSDATQKNIDSRVQLNNFQQNSDNTFQSRTSQQNRDNTFQTFTSQPNTGNRFQFKTNQQNTGRITQENSNQQNTGARFQDRFNQQNAASRSQINTNDRFTQQNQFQGNAFQRSGSSFENSDDTISGFYEPLNLPSGASTLLGGISTSFNCLDRPYGYYADQDNACRVFHVCNPALFSGGAVQTFQYSFMCGEGTVFDQKEMTCVMESSATPCQEASNYYVRNQEFGRLEDRQF